MTVGIGICTFNRPDMLEKCGKALKRNLYVDGKPVFNHLYVINDGSDPKHHGAYERAYRPLRACGAVIIDEPVNAGVAASKNVLLRAMLARKCDFLFLLEDDILIQSPKAVTEYVRVMKARDSHHLSFAHHGPANQGGPVHVDDDISYYPHSIGAWTCFSRQSLDIVGIFDENFQQAWEHVEHELRLIQEGLMPGAAVHRFPDVTGSQEWLMEIPNSIEKSSIRPRSDWKSNIRNGLLYWAKEKPETYAMLFGPDKPLYGYAQGIIGE